MNDDLYKIDKAVPNLQMDCVRHFTAMGTVNSLIALEQRNPFFDNDCVELIYSTLDEYRLNNKLYSAMLHKIFSKFFKDTPWQQTGRPASLTKAKNILTRALNKVVRELKVLVGIKLIQGYTDYKAWIRSPEISEYLSQLLKSDTAKYTELTSDDSFINHLEPHLNATYFDESHQILRVATIEVYLRQVNDVRLPE